MTAVPSQSAGVSAWARVPVWAFAVLLGVFLLATNSYPVPASNGPLIDYAASDGWSYRAIGVAFPDFPLPTAYLIHHHAQRFAAPWLVGGFSSVTGLSIDAAFRIVAIALLAGITGLLLATINAVNRLRWDRLLLIAVFLLQPVATRFYVSFPWIIPDLVFVLGLTAVVRGIALDRVAWIIGGVLVAATGRQTALLIIPALVVWALLAGPGSSRSKLTRLSVVVGSAAAAGAIYLVTDHYSQPFSTLSVNEDMLTGLFSWLADRFSAHELVDFMGRGALPLLLPIGLFAGALFTRSRPIKWRIVAPLLVLAASIAAQPLLGGPVITGNNFARLALLGIPALLVALAVVLDSVDPPAAPRPWQIAVTAVALLIGSMHHITSLIGHQNSSGSTAFGVLSVVVAAVVLAVTWWWRFPRVAALRSHSGSVTTS